MKIKIISSDALFEMKDNLPFLMSEFNQVENTALLARFPECLLESKFESENIILRMDSDKPFETELENVKELYGRLKFLSPSQASDERLWAGLAIDQFWKYTKWRWKIDEKLTENNIQSHFFFKDSVRRALMRNAIARLWWIGKLSYDEKNPNPYELTEFLCENANFIQRTLEISMSNNYDITKNFLYGILKARKEGFITTKDSFGKLASYLDLLGGTYIVDAIPGERLQEKIRDRSLKMLKGDSNVT